MIRKILTTYAARLDEYLARSHRQPALSLIWNGKPAATAAICSVPQPAMPADVSRCNLVDIGAIGSAKTALQATAGPFSQNRLLLGQRLHPLSGTTAAAKLASLLRMKTAAIKKAGRQYRVVRWFLLPEGELRARQAGSSRLQVFDN